MSADQDSEWTESGWTCPSCSAAMPDGAVVCISCGYDKRTGRRVNEPPPSRLGYHIATTVVAISLALGVRYYFMKPPPAAKPTQPVAAVSPAPVAAPAPAPTSTPAVTVSVAATNPAPVVPDAPKIDTNEIARLAHLAELARMEELKEEVRRQFDTKAPMFVAGEDVALRMTNAIVRRGTFRRIKDESVILAISSNEETAVQFETLDLNTRLRCDAEFRAKYMDHVAGRAAKMEK